MLVEEISEKICPSEIDIVYKQLFIVYTGCVLTFLWEWLWTEATS